MMDQLERDSGEIAESLDLGPLQGRSVLVTGGSGLLGQNLISVLCHARGELTVGAHPVQEFGLHKFDVIIHAAGHAQPVKFLRDPVGTLDIHAVVPMRLMQRHLAPGGKFLYLSSSEVTIGSTHMPHTEEDIGTTSPAHVRSAYIEGKRCGEAAVYAFRQMGVDAKIARVSLAYGPGFQQTDERAILGFVRQAVTKGEIRLLDAGSARRTFGYTRDIIEMLLNVLLYGTQPVYNVAGISNTSILGLAQEIGEIAGVPVIAGHGQDGVPGGPDDVKLDLTRYCTEFGKDTFVPLREGLERTINYARQIFA